MTCISVINHSILKVLCCKYDVLASSLMSLESVTATHAKILSKKGFLTSFW